MTPAASGEPVGLVVFDAAMVTRLLDPLEAVRAVEDALRAGLDPAGTPARSSVPLGEGELLLMPASSADGVGVKVVSIAPGNPGRGMPRVQGLHVLFDAVTLSPRAVVDGAALTTLRTPAVSIAAVRPALDGRELPLRTVVFGAGPQGIGHLRTAAAALLPQPGDGPEPRPDSEGTPVLDATVVVRDVARAVVPHLRGVRTRLVGVRDPEVATALARAELVVCATTARVPLFRAEAVGDHVVVVAVGSHELDAWEVEPALAERAQLVVEDRTTAVREAGVVHAVVTGGSVPAQDLVPMRDMVLGTVAPARDRPLLFVSVGMAWEDLVVAQRVHRSYLGRAAQSGSSQLRVAPRG